MTEIDRGEESDGDNSSDFCRVCRCGATSSRALFYPCLCTGSIKYVHQDCLMQWLKHSKREFCELCKHKFAFAPIYSADMPPRLPITILLHGLLSSVRSAVYSWFHYTLVAVAWLLVVPLTACRICRSLFTGSVASLLTLPLDMLSADNIMLDCLYGIVVVAFTLGTFVCFMWVREQIMMNGGPEWLDMRNRQQPPDLLQQQPDHQNEQIVPGGGNILDGARNLLPHMLNALAPVPENGEMHEDDLMFNNDDHDVQDAIEENNGDMLDNGGEDDNINQNVANNANNNNNLLADPINHGIGNFNLEWGRAGDELTWEKLIGLDGSLFFLEHVFWIVSLNTLFILVFAFCPYHIGYFTVMGFKMNRFVAWTRIDGVVTTVVGYIIIAFGLLFLHKILKTTKFKYFEKPCHLTGLAFIIIKVALLTILEIGVVPLLCGVWIDICSLNMFNSTTSQRHNLFQHSPITFIFLHWTVGVMYLFYFATFLLMLKEMLRPGVFWFLKNFNDPNFNPIQDMINQSVPRLIKRFCINCSLFSIIIFIMVWIPNKIIRFSITGFLPYKFQTSKDSPMDYSLEILFLQVVLPMLFDGHAMFWFKAIVKFWCLSVSRLLDMRSFLLGDIPFENGDIIINYGGHMQRVTYSPDQAGSNLSRAAVNTRGASAAAAAGMTNYLSTQGPNGNYRPYKLPRGATHFGWRFMMLLALTLVSIVVFSTLTLTVPVYIGRCLLNMLGITVYCDLISLLCGFSTIAVVTKSTYSCYEKVVRGDGGLRRLRNRILSGLFIVWKLLVLSVVVFVWIPLVLGLLINLCVLSPIRVPLDKSIILSFWENWMFGMMHLKIWVMLLLFGPRWWFRERIEAMEQELARRENLRLVLLLRQAGPFIAAVTLSVTGPYVLAKSVAPLLFADDHYVFRRIYPVMFLFGILVLIIWFQFRQLHRLYEHIKNERYLVGQQLVNYER